MLLALSTDAASEVARTLDAKMAEPPPTQDEQQRIVRACDALKALADHLAAMLGGKMIEAESVTQQILTRQLVVVVRQVHSIALLVGLPYYAEQAGQLVRGLAELTRIVLWLDEPDDADERLVRALTFWKDGVRQTRSKYEYQERIGREILESEWEALEKQEALVADQESGLGRKVGGLPDARAMWEELGREDLYGLFRWESDPAHGSAVTLGTVVHASSETHFDLGGPNLPRDRARRLGAALALLQLAGTVIVEGLGQDVESWRTASSHAEAEMSDLLMSLL